MRSAETVKWNAGRKVSDDVMTGKRGWQSRIFLLLPIDCVGQTVNRARAFTQTWDQERKCMHGKR